MNVIKNIRSIILELAIRENEELMNLTKVGLKKMPELAFSYICGKEMFKYREVVFGTKEIEWEREVTINKGSGPSDLIFYSRDKSISNYVIEFKLDDTWHKYKNDIDKLKNLKEPGWIKLFCSFKYVFIEKSKNIDQSKDFLNDLNNAFGDNAVSIGDPVNIKTFVKYHTKDYLLFTFWHVK